MMHGIFNLLNTLVREKSCLADNSEQHIYMLKVNRIKLKLKAVNKALNSVRCG